jgi:predicted enzyme related to lactoylglutathione lyase
MHTKINWFEIPATDFDRSMTFYESVFDSKLQREDFGGAPMGLFNNANGESIGCVVHSAQHAPGESGALIYLDASPSIDAVISRIQPAGGRLLLEKTQLPAGHGYIAQFVDTEGNRLALHAMN